MPSCCASVALILSLVIASRVYAEASCGALEADRRGCRQRQPYVDRGSHEHVEATGRIIQVAEINKPNVTVLPLSSDFNDNSARSVRVMVDTGDPCR